MEVKIDKKLIQIEQRDINDIKLYNNNPRVNDVAVEKTAMSIKEYGWKQPIVVDADGVVIVGHTRLKAAQKLEYGKVPVIVANDLSPAQAKAYRIADNRTGEISTWDVDLLNLEIKDLMDMNFNVELTGFDIDDFEFLKDENHNGLTDGDDVPEPPEEAITKLGDLWMLGEHRLLCGDATNKEDVDRLMDGKKADMVFADPPYGVGYEYNSHNDEMSAEDYKDFCCSWFERLQSISDKIIITPGCVNLGLWFSLPLPTHVGIWTKTNAMTHGPITHFWVWEPILFFGQFKKKRANDLFNYPVGQQKDVGDHTCPKPLPMVIDIVDNFSERKDIVLDIFLGSGSTLIACEKTSRTCYGMEIDPHYCDVIINRWENFTGKKAVLKENHGN